jgi:phosphoribosylformylglycinamidine cyclo-ligase
VGFAVGIKKPRQVRLEAGDLILGISSNGPHANGFSLIRKLVEEGKIKWEDEISGRKFWEIALEPTRIYSHLVPELIEKGVKAFVHVTGGGIPGNLRRILPPHLDAIIEEDAWEIPPFFKLIKEKGRVPVDEMRRVFNLGVGFILIVGEDRFEETKEFLRNSEESHFLMGRIARGSGRVLFT